MVAISSVVSQSWEDDSKLQYLRIWKEAFINHLNLLLDMYREQGLLYLHNATGLLYLHNATGRVPISCRERKLLYSPQCPHRFRDQPNLLSIWYQCLFPQGIKQPGREANHLSLSSVEMKNSATIPPLTRHLVRFFASAQS